MATLNQFGQDMELIRQTCKPIWKEMVRELAGNVHSRNALKQTDWVSFNDFCDEVALELRAQDSLN